MKETSALRFPLASGPRAFAEEVSVPSCGQATPWWVRPHMEHGFPRAPFALGFVGGVKTRETVPHHLSVTPKVTQDSSKVSKSQNHHQGSWLKNQLPIPEGSESRGPGEPSRSFLPSIPRESNAGGGRNTSRNVS